MVYWIRVRPKDDRSAATPLVFRRKREDRDSSELLIRIVAGVLLVVAVLTVSAHFREKKHLESLMLAAQADERARLAAARLTGQPAELETQQLARAQQSAQAERQIYRCVDPTGATSIQNEPCPAGASVSWGRAVPVETPLEASLRQQEWDKQQGETRLRQAEAQFAQATGTAGANQTYYSLGNPPDAASSRCQIAKNARDQAYRVAGNNRSFELIRSWNDYVYEACKGT